MKKLFLLLALFTVVFSCKKDSPCEGVECMHDGVCNDGTCACIGLWKGKNCTEQITPILITLRSIANTKMPSTDINGAGWDLTSGPDVYFVIKQNGVVLISTQDNWAQDANQGTTWPIHLSISNVYDDITIELWDYDSFDNDDFMGSVSGKIYNDTNGFPETIVTDCFGCKVEFTFGDISYL